MRHWVRQMHPMRRSVRPTHPMPPWGANPNRRPPNPTQPRTHPARPKPQPIHPTSEAPSPSPAPRYEAQMRTAGACQGIFPALTSTRRPSSQSSFGVPHATMWAQCRRQATSRNKRDSQIQRSPQSHIDLLLNLPVNLRDPLRQPRPIQPREIQRGHPIPGIHRNPENVLRIPIQQLSPEQPRPLRLVHPVRRQQNDSPLPSRISRRVVSPNLTPAHASPSPQPPAPPHPLPPTKRQGRPEPAAGYTQSEPPRAEPPWTARTRPRSRVLSQPARRTRAHRCRARVSPYVLPYLLPYHSHRSGSSHNVGDRPSNGVDSTTVVRVDTFAASRIRRSRSSRPSGEATRTSRM